MSDWAVGDLAVRVHVERTPQNAHRFCGKGAAIGSTFSVIGVVGPIAGEVGLILDGLPSPHPTGAWSEIGYRKIRPDEHEACETEFVTLLKRSKQRVSA